MPQKVVFLNDTGKKLHEERKQKLVLLGGGKYFIGAAALIVLDAFLMPFVVMALR